MSGLRKVGKFYAVEFENKDVRPEKNGWVDVKKYLPEDGELVDVRIGRKVIPAWTSGNKWFGLKLKEKDVVKYWKFRPPEERECP